jgi:Trypsin
VFDNRASHKVTLGTISRRNPSVGHVVVNVAQAIRHPSFNGATLANDIGILKFASNVALSSRS